MDTIYSGAHGRNASAELGLTVCRPTKSTRGERVAQFADKLAGQRVSVAGPPSVAAVPRAGADPARRGQRGLRILFSPHT